MTRGLPAWVLALGLTFCHPVTAAARPDVQTIIANSVVANDADWKAAPEFDFTERDKTKKGTKTYRVAMILGSPYYRLAAVNDEPLAPAAEAEQQRNLQSVIAQRRAESPEQRSKRISKYEKAQARNHTLLSQLTVAFDFTFKEEANIGPYKVYVLSATPRAAYKPPTMECQALTGMEGTLWIDQATFQWVKVQAHVIRPVSIEGFLAQVEPGTQFEFDCAPVEGNIWLPTHFAMKSRSKVLHLFAHKTQDNETYSQYQRATPLNGAAPDSTRSSLESY
jgi:hypothetical protein